MVDFNKLLQQARTNTNAAAPVVQSPAPPAALNVPSPEVSASAVQEKAPDAAAPSLDLGMEPGTYGGEKNDFATDEPKGAEIEYPGLPDLRQRIYSLEEAMKSNHPAMDSLLQTIHRNLDKDPELIHLLKPNETSILFGALQKKTQTKIVQETVKSAGSGKSKKLKNIGIEDL